MEAKKFKFIGANGVMLPGVIWYPTCTPSMIVQITHGMTEHIGRYEQLAEHLTSYGIAVAGFDLRGHGHNPGNRECASFGENGWNATLHDMHLFYMELESRFPHIPHVMFGYSLGSFLVRDFLSHYFDNVDGAVIVGTGYQMGAVIDMFKTVVKQEIKKHGFDNSSPRVNKLSYEAYNKRFAPNSSAVDWLCSDTSQLTEYMKDPYCRQNISSGLFWQMLDSMKRTGSVLSHLRWDRKMPVLLLSGEDDPVGDFGRGALRVKQIMDKAGMEDVQLHTFPNARHDLFHEVESGTAEEAIELLTSWLLEKI